MYKMVDGVTIKMTDEEIAKLNASQPTDEEILAEKWNVRRERNSLLAASDWRASTDVTLSDDWKTYRQALRDVPSSQTDPDNITWPTKPS